LAPSRSSQVPGAFFFESGVAQNCDHYFVLVLVALKVLDESHAASTRPGASYLSSRIYHAWSHVHPGVCHQSIRSIMGASNESDHRVYKNPGVAVPKVSCLSILGRTVRPCGTIRGASVPLFDVQHESRPNRYPCE
jgi:hypothetical protein